MASLVTIYKKKNYKIYDAGNGKYIIHNTNLDFENHHSHVHNFNTCKYIIDLCINRTVPYYLSEYLLESILLQIQMSIIYAILISIYLLKMKMVLFMTTGMLQKF